jgi:hypothetical protein
MSESNTKNSKVDLPHSVAMVDQALDMVESVAMEIVLLIDQTLMVAQEAAMEDTNLPLPPPQAAF